MNTEMKINKNGIKIADREKIKSVLSQVNGRASCFVATIVDVESAAEEAEARLDAGRLPQTIRVGCRAEYRTGGPSANAYRYAAAGTVVHLIRARDGWRLVDAKRIGVHPKQKEKLTVIVSEQAAEEIKKRSVADFKIALEI